MDTRKRKQYLLKTRLVVVTFFPITPTQSRLSANDTTPHLLAYELNSTIKSSYEPADETI